MPGPSVFICCMRGDVCCIERSAFESPMLYAGYPEAAAVAIAAASVTYCGCIYACIGIVAHRRHHLVLRHLLRLLVLRVGGLLLGLHDGTCLVRLLRMGVRVRVWLLLELLGVRFHGGDGVELKGSRLRVEAEGGVFGSGSQAAMTMA